MAPRSLSGTDIDVEVAKPGVLFLHWWGPSPTQTLSLAAFESIASRNPAVRFASVNAVLHSGSARDFQVTSLPTLMVYRDGVLIFSASGGVVPEQVEQLLLAVEALDMEEVRRARNGGGKGRPSLPLTWGDPGKRTEPGIGKSVK